MNANERRRALEPVLLPRLLALLGDETTVNDSPLAHAVTTIAALEADRIAKGGSPEARAQALTDDMLVQIADMVRDKISSHYGSRDHLPSGQEIASFRPGRVKYGGRTTVMPGGYSKVSGGRCYQLSMAAPGLYLDEDLPSDAEPVERFRRELLHALRPWRSPDIPQLTLDDIRIERTSLWQHSITIPVRSVAGETVDHVRTHSRIDLMTTAEWQAEKTWHVNRERDHWHEGPSLDAETIALRAIVQRHVDKAVEQGLPVRLVGVQVNPKNVHGGGGGCWRTFLVEVLGNSLSPEIWSTGVTTGVQPQPGRPAPDPHGDLDKAVANQMGVQRRRWRTLKEARAKGASGSIDTITLAALRAGDRDVATILREVVEGKRTSLTVPDHGTMRLSWRNGVVHSSFDLSPEIAWSYGKIILKKDTIPATVIQALKDQPVSALIGHDFMDPSATIRSITQRKDWSWMRINIAVATVAFNHETGEILDDVAQAA